MSDHSILAASRPNIRLRPARAADRRFAEALYLGTMLPLLTRLGQGDAEALRARFARGYRRARSRIIGAGLADVGWMQVTPHAAGLHLDQLHLVEGWRGRGIGSLLLGRLLTRAGRLGVDVRLDVIHGNPAIALYRRFGFEVDATDHEKNRMVRRVARG